MSDELEQIRDYLSPPSHAIWQWAEEGEVITWSDGVTIVFRAELLEVLRRLAPQGLPPLGAVVFLLAACRQSWSEASQTVASLAGQFASVTRRGIPPWLPDVMAGLDRIANLPGEAIFPTNAKATLAGIVFEGTAGRTSPALTRAILQTLADGVTDEFLRRDDSLIKSDLLGELRALSVGLTRVDAEGLQLRQRTGLDTLIEPAELDLEPAERARRLIFSLQDDSELGGVARVARQLMAAVHLPRAVSDPEDLPLGGVSDITNRGSLDRLLLSELAHDELTLALRIALREALYLRRESPPRSPPQHRAVLVDVGLRMWGVPRVFAAGAALALAAGGDRQFIVDSFQSQGRSAVAIDLGSREGLIKHLESLQPDAHPGDSLDAFLSDASEEKVPRDVLIVTGADVVADPDFQKALSAWKVESVYLATVARDGRFQLHLRSGRGSRLVCQAQLDLDDLLRPRPKRSLSLIDSQTPRELPAICALEAFPFLLPHAVAPERMWPADPIGVLAVTRDRRLMYWERGGQGARQLTDKFPTAGSVVWYKLAARNRPVAAIIHRGSDGPYCLVTAVPERGEFTSVMLELELRGLRTFCEFQGTLFAGYAHGSGSRFISHIVAVDMHSGRRLAACPRIGQEACARLGLAHGRIFPWNGGKWKAVAWDGQAICWETVVDIRLLDQRKTIIAMVMPDGYEGCLGMTSSGELFHSSLCSGEGQYRQVLPAASNRSYSVIASAMDGQVLLLGDSEDARRAWRVDLPEGRVTRLPRSGSITEMLMRAQLTPTVWSESLPWHFQEIYVGDDALTLISRRGHAWRLELDASQSRLRMRRLAIDDTLVGVPSKLEQTARPPGTGYELRLARWEDGTIAWIDSRGLLHLKSSDPELPELTLVLYERHVSGWTSDGHLFGTKYFLGRSETITAAEIARNVLRPILARVR